MGCLWCGLFVALLKVCGLFVVLVVCYISAWLKVYGLVVHCVGALLKLCGLFVVWVVCCGRDPKFPETPDQFKRTIFRPGRSFCS